jgi:hypothetical protein
VSDPRPVGLPTKSITIRLTPRQARVLWGVVDGALDAGACDGGLDAKESAALSAVSRKIIGLR